MTDKERKRRKHISQHKYYRNNRRKIIAHQEEYNHKHHDKYAKYAMNSGTKWYIRKRATYNQLIIFKRLINRKLKQIKEVDMNG